MFLRQDLTDISVGVKMHKFPLFQITPNDNQTPQAGPLNVPTTQPGKPNKFTGVTPVSKFLECELSLQSGSDHLINRVVFFPVVGGPITANSLLLT